MGATASPARRYALDSGRRAARRGCHPNHGQPDETSVAVPGRRDEVERAADQPERSPRYCWIISPITRSDGGAVKSETFRRCNCWISFVPVKKSLSVLVLADDIGPHKIMWATD